MCLLLRTKPALCDKAKNVFHTAAIPRLDLPTRLDLNCLPISANSTTSVQVPLGLSSSNAFKSSISSSNKFVSLGEINCSKFSSNSKVSRIMLTISFS